MKFNLHLSLLVLSLAWISTLQSQTCTSNLITNPGFESGLTGWTTSGTLAISPSAHSGAKAAEACGGPASISQAFPAIPGQVYTASAWAKGTLSNALFAPTIWVRFLQSNYAPIGDYTTAPYESFKNVLTNQYEQYQVTATAPANAAFVHLLVFKEDGGCFTIDDLELCQGAGAGNNLPELFSIDFTITSNLQNPNGSTQVNSSFILRNTGTGNITNDFSLVWRVSADEIPSANDYILRSELYTNDLAPSQSVNIDRSDIIPVATASLPPGNYWLIISLDEGNTVTEVSEGNNFQSRFINVFGTTVCALNASITSIQCSNNGTPGNSADDVFSFSITATSSLQGIGYQILQPPVGTAVNGTYGTPLTFQNVPVSIGVTSIQLQDIANPACSTSVVLTPPAPCSNGGGTGQIDLSMALQQLTPSPAIYSNYSVKATVNNAGPQTATGVKVKLAKPTGVVYVGSNPFSASQGSFNPNGNEEWTVGSIPAGGAATLTLNYFLLQATAPVVYTQVIAAGQTDGDSQPNNGTPTTPNQDDEASTSGGGSNSLADLTIVDLQIPNMTITNGALLNYNFDVSNLSTVIIPGSFIAKAYISTDNVLSTNDILGGTVNIGSFSAVFMATDISGNAIIPANLAAGNYFLIVKVDADGQVTESNENNNVVSKAFTIAQVSVCDITYPITIDEVLCSSQSASGYTIVSRAGTQKITATFDNNRNLLSQTTAALPDEITYSGANNVLTKFVNGVQVWQKNIPATITNIYNTINANLPVTESATGTIYLGLSRIDDAGSAILKTSSTLVLQGTTVFPLMGTQAVATLNLLPDGSLLLGENTNSPFTNARYFRATVPGNIMYEFTLSGNREQVKQSFCGDGYKLRILSFWGIGGGFGGSSLIKYTHEIELTATGIKIIKTCTQQEIFQQPGILNNGFTSAVYDATGGRSEISWTSNSVFPDPTVTTTAALRGYDAANNQLWIIPLPSSYPANSCFQLFSNGQQSVIIFGKQAGGTSLWSTSVPCSNSTGQQPDLTIADLQIPTTSVAAGAVLNYNFDLSNIGAEAAPGNFNVKSYISTDNILSANDIQDGIVATGNFNAGFVVNNVPAATTIPANLAAGSYFLIVKVDADGSVTESNENNNVVSKPFTVTTAGGGTPNCNSITITPGQGNITIAGAVAPHVLIKVFRPNWTVAFECLDGACSNPQVVSGLSAGSHFVEIKLFNASWGLICTKTQTVNLNSFGGGNSNLRTAEEEAKMTIDKFYPNPAQHWMNFELYSPKKQETRLDFFDQLGIRVYTLKVELDAGVNTIELELSDFKSGIYNVIARGDGQLAYGRFVKIWEE